MPWTSDLLNNFDWFIHATSTKESGSLRYPDKHKVEDKWFVDRENFIKQLGLDPEYMVLSGNIHSVNVKYLTKDTKGKIYVSNTDGLLTDQSKIVIGLKTADCLPIFIADPHRKIVGLFHAGWQGVALQMVTTSVKAFENYGSRAIDLKVAIGPSIRQCHYGIHSERKDEMLNKSKYVLPEDFIEKDGQYFVGLQGIVTRELLENGVLPHNIDNFAPCTACNSGVYFSYHLTKDSYQSMLSIISILE